MEEKKKNPVNSLTNDVCCTILGIGLYTIGVFGCISFGIMVPSMAIATYVSYGLIGTCLGCLATHVLKNDIKEYKNYKTNQRTYYEHFPITKVEYEKRPRYQIDREKGCKLEDFYRAESSYSNVFVYESDSNQKEGPTLEKKYRG